MRKFVLLWLLTILLMNYIYAVSITDLSMIDYLSKDLSMRETILIHIENNTEGEFKLALPDGAYDITVNGFEFENLTVSEEISCKNCSTEISYSFPAIVQNDSGNYTFYRKIDFPINVNLLNYRIILPENYSLFNISDLRISILPNPSSIIDNNTFEWKYGRPEFPVEFAVRYVDDDLINSQADKFPTDNFQIDYSSIIMISVTTFFSLFLIVILLMFVKKKR